MNQILSVEMPKSKSKKPYRNSSSKKASIKSVVIFFCIILLIFGIAMVGLGIYSKLKDGKNSEVPEENKPIINISQGTTTLELDITGKNEISKIQYNWNGETNQELPVNGTTNVRTSIDIPTGTNTLNILVTDVEGITNQYSNQYTNSSTTEPNVDPIAPVPNDELDANLKFDDTENKLKIAYEGEQVINHIIYYYDIETENTVQVNDTKFEQEIDIKEGEHNLTLKVVYEDGTQKQITKKVYFPYIERELTLDGNLSFKATDTSKITKIAINFNGQESEIQVDNENYENIFQSITGENRLIITIYNTAGVYTKRAIKWVK